MGVLGEAVTRISTEQANYISAILVILDSVKATAMATSPKKVTVEILDSFRIAL